jgi:hypothetical protein
LGGAKTVRAVLSQSKGGSKPFSRGAALDYREPSMHLARFHRRVVEAGSQKLADGPDVIGNPLRHRRRNAKRLMDAAEIEMGNEQSDRRQMVVSALAEAVG